MNVVSSLAACVDLTGEPDLEALFYEISPDACVANPTMSMTRLLTVVRTAPEPTLRALVSSRQLPPGLLATLLTRCARDKIFSPEFAEAIATHQRLGDSAGAFFALLLAATATTGRYHHVAREVMIRPVQHGLSLDFVLEHRSTVRLDVLLAYIAHLPESRFASAVAQLPPLYPSLRAPALCRLVRTLQARPGLRVWAQQSRHPQVVGALACALPSDNPRAIARALHLTHWPKTPSYAWSEVYGPAALVVLERPDLIPWLHRRVRRAMSGFIERHHVEGLFHPITQDLNDLDKSDPLPPPTEDEPEVLARVQAEFADPTPGGPRPQWEPHFSVTLLNGFVPSPTARAWAIERLGRDPQRWRVAYSLFNYWEGTIHDGIETALALAECRDLR